MTKIKKQQTNKKVMSNYPPGAANDPEAPYNEPNIPEIEFEVTASFSLSKTVKCMSNDYTPETVKEPHNGIHEEYPNTTDTDWAGVYADGCHKTIPELLEILKKVLKENKDKGIVYKSPWLTDAIIKECEGWTVDEVTYVGE